MRRLLLLLLLLPRVAGATSYMKPSFELTAAEAIEDMFAEANAVVIGQIDAVETRKVPFEGGFVLQQHGFVSIQRVLKGEIREKRISFEPGMLQDMTETPLSFWSDHHAVVVLFLWDLDQRKLERKHPDSAGTSWTHAWCLEGRVPGYGVPVQSATSELLARLDSLKAAHRVEALAREADVVVLGAWKRENDRTEIAVQRALKGQVGARLLPTFKGFEVFPKSAALFFLRRQDLGFEILRCSAGVKPVRGGRLRQDGMSLDEAIKRIEASAR